MLHYRLSRRVGLIALATVAALVAAACGGSGEEGGGGGGDGDATIGILVPLTGELGSFGGPWQQTVEFAVDEINEIGGLPEDAELSTVVDDEKADPEVAVQAARRMVEVEDVSAIIGPSSAAMVALVPFAKRAQVPVIGVASGTVSLNELGGDFVYRTVASDASDGLAIAKFLNEQGAQDVGLLVQNEESTLSPAQIFQTAYEDSGGTVAQKVVYNPGQPSYRAELEEVLSVDPAWIVCACGQESGISLIQEARAAGYEGNLMVTADIVTPEAIEAAGADVMEGAYGEVASADTDLPTYKAFAEAYEEVTGEEPYAFNANTYDATILVALAMIRSGGTDGASINEAIREVANPPGTQCTSYEECMTALGDTDDIDYEGASGPVNLDESGTASSPYSVQQVKDGEWTQIGFYPAEDFVTE